MKRVPILAISSIVFLIMIASTLYFKNNQFPDSNNKKGIIIQAEKDPDFHTLSPIKNLFVIMQENHSFDNYFGVYPNCNGFHPFPHTPQVEGFPNHAFSYNKKGNKVYPYPLSQKQWVTEDLPHGYEKMIKAYDNGKMDQFVAVFQEHYSNGGNLPMGYYDYRTLPAYWDYAQHFTLADHWFTPIFGPTSPNVLYLVSAQAGTRDNPVTHTRLGKKYRFIYPNIGDRLTEKDIGWEWYERGVLKTKHGPKDNPFTFFKKYDEGKYKRNIQALSQFQQDLKNRWIGSVVFIKAHGRDEHPGTNVNKGMNFIVGIINNIMNSSYWKNSAIILTYDESGGFYDHVAPPDRSHFNNDGLKGDGPRVPTLILSPFAKQNYVSHMEYDSTSILKFIEWNWGLQPLNQRDRNANNLLDCFDFNQLSPPFLINQKSEKSPVIYFNDFKAASTGYGDAYISNNIVYITIQDVSRNLNAAREGNCISTDEPGCSRVSPE